MDEMDHKEIENLQIICNRLSEKRVQLTPSASAYTDGKTIYLPLGYHPYKDLTGFASHEAFHIRAGSFRQILEDCIQQMHYKFKTSYQICRYIVNITEDFRVNQWIKLTYEGFFKNLDTVEERLIEHEWSKKPKLSVVEEIGLIFLKEEIVKKHIKLSVLTEKHIKRIRAIKDDLLNNLSAEQSIKAAWDLCKIYYELREDDVNNQNNKNKQKTNQNAKNQSGGKNQSNSNDSGSNENSNDLDEKSGDSNKQSGSGKSEEKDKNTDNSSSQMKGESSSGGCNGSLGDFEDEMNGFLDDIDDFTHKQDYDNQEIYNLDNKDKKNKDVSGVDNNSDIDRAKELRKALDKISSDKMSNKDLERAAENAKKEIEKILEEGNNKKSSFSTESGLKCERISDKKKVIENSKGVGSDIMHDVNSNSNKYTYKTIVSENRNLIYRLRKSLTMKSERAYMTRGHTKGRLNRDVVRYVASGYTDTSCYSRMTVKNKGKMMLLMDLSGSMSGDRIKRLKESVIVIVEALKETTDFRVVGYTSGISGAVTIIFKEFGEKLDVAKMDAIGLRYEGGGTPTSIAVETEVHFLTSREGNVKNKIPLLLFTDGEPNDYKETVRVFKKMRKTVKIFGIGIGTYGKRMSDLFGANFVLINKSDELKGQLITLAKKIVKGFNF